MNHLNLSLLFSFMFAIKHPYVYKVALVYMNYNTTITTYYINNYYLTCFTTAPLISAPRSILYYEYHLNTKIYVTRIRSQLLCIAITNK